MKTCKLTGTATKQGAFNVTFKATKKGATTETASSTFISEFGCLDIYVHGEGTVTGGGTYPAGKKVTLKATAAKGYVFAGWQKRVGGGLSNLTGGDVDYRTASYPYVTDVTDEELKAVFVTPEEDQSTFNFNNAGAISTLTDGSFSGDGFSISSRITSKSLPVITMSDLPSGLKFDAKKFLITGKATKPGTYTVKVTAKNASVNPAIKKDLTIIVPNLKWDSSKTGLSTIRASYTLPNGEVAGNAFLNNNPFLVQNGYKLAVSGLPSGVNYDAKTGLFSGIATKEGDFIVYFKATKSGVPTETATATFKSVYSELKINYDKECGTVTGMGRYPANKKITLKATAKNGYAFAGWYDGENPLDGDADYRQTSFEYVTGSSAATLTAKFVGKAQDISEFQNNANGVSIVADGLIAYDMREIIISHSLPTVTVSGLPTGLKFDSKKLAITGKSTKPGIYKVKVSAKNASVKTAVVKEMTITVPNLQSGLYDGRLDYALPSRFYEFALSQRMDHPLINVSSGIPSGAKVSVTGLPSGMKFDSNTGNLTGAPTKAGTYTVTLTTTIGKEKYTDTVTFTIQPIASWAVGTFQGYSDNGNMMTVTVTANGAISGKIACPVDGKIKTVSFSSKNVGYGYETYRTNSDSEIDWEIPNVKWHDGTVSKIEIIIIPMSCDNGGAVFGTMRFVIDENYSGAGKGLQNPWTVSPKPELVPKISGTLKVPKTEFKNGDAAELSISSKGVATVKYYKGAGKNVSWTATGNMLAHAQAPTLSLWSYFVNVMSPDGGIYTFYIIATSNEKGVLNAAAVFLKPEGMSLEISEIEPLYMGIDLSGGTSASGYDVFDIADVPLGGWTDMSKTDCLVLRRIPKGTFLMGSPEDEPGRDVDETQHSVTLTKDYWMGVFEVTQRQWELVMGTRPSYFNNNLYYATRPVEQVSYDMIRGSSNGAKWPSSSAVDSYSFIGRLRAKTGIDFDLPTEAQWEYACRAGTTTALNSGKKLTDANMAEVGRYWNNSGMMFSSSCATTAGTAKVGSYKPNAWGLYDMHYNVYEWCLDFFGAFASSSVTNPAGANSGSRRILRGASWYSDIPAHCRLAYRECADPSIRMKNYGLRLVVIPTTP